MPMNMIAKTKEEFLRLAAELGVPWMQTELVAGCEVQSASGDRVRFEPAPTAIPPAIFTVVVPPLGENAANVVEGGFFHVSASVDIEGTPRIDGDGTLTFWRGRIIAAFTCGRWAYFMPKAV